MNHEDKASIKNPRYAEVVEAKVSIIINIILWMLRLTGGLMVNSVAVVADAWHSMSNNLTSLMVYISGKVGSKPPDTKHPYGHGRIVDVLALLMGLGLIAIACHIVFNSILGFIHGYSLMEDYVSLTLVILLLTSIAKEVLARYAMRLSKLSGSKLCYIDAWHHRVDALLGLATLLSILLYSMTNLLLIDSIMALTISLIIGFEGFKVSKESILTLMDTQTPYFNELAKQVAQEVKGVECIHDIRARSYGGVYFVELKVHVNPKMSIIEAHELAHRVEEKIKEKDERIVEVITHIEPAIEPC